jgi:hypothetical protein
VELRPEYRHEERGESQAYPGSTVTYLDADARRVYKVCVIGGRLCDAGGRWIDTRDAVAHRSHNQGRALYVMDGGGEIFVSIHQQRGVFHHSSLVSGAPVAAAGRIRVEAGLIREITNESGHYRPSRELSHQFLLALAQMKLAGELPEPEWI